MYIPFIALVVIYCLISAIRTNQERAIAIQLNHNADMKRLAEEAEWARQREAFEADHAARRIALGMAEEEYWEYVREEDDR